MNKKKYILTVIGCIVASILFYLIAKNTSDFPQDKLNEATAIAFAGLLLINLSPDSKRAKK